MSCIALIMQCLTLFSCQCIQDCCNFAQARDVCMVVDIYIDIYNSAAVCYKQTYCADLYAAYSSANYPLT